MLLVDKDPRHAGQMGERAQKRTSLAVQHVDSVGARVRDVDPPAGPVDVSVVEAGPRPRWHRDEAGADEAHAAVPTAVTSVLHQA